MQDNDESAGFQPLGNSSDAAQPKYEQLREYVIAQIESGHFKAGASLPSENRIAEILQIARSTVRQAMAVLERDGLVRRIHGKGTFVHEHARQRLKKGQDLFALIMPETETGFYPSLQKSVEETAAAHHNQVIICNSANEIDRQGNAILQLIDLQVAGVVIVPTTHPKTPAYQVRQLQKHGIPVVCCSRRIDGVQSPLLAIPFEEVGRKAGTLLREHGHRSVGFFTTNPTEWARMTEAAFRTALGPGSEVHLFHGRQPSPDVATHEHDVTQTLNAMLESPNPPTALYATFDSMAELLYLILNRKGIRVPEEMSLVGFGGVRRYGALSNRMTSITLDEQLMGRTAIELLCRMRNGELSIDSAVVQEMPLGISNGQTLANHKARQSLQQS